jgi:SAM-dependent methyltransferase
MPAAFDKYSENYDQHFTRSAIGQLQRSRVYRILQNQLKKIGNNANILEISCGTGEDALWMARRGFKVEATDISSGMIEVANRKKQIRQIEHLNFHICPFSEISNKFKKESFQFAFSNFGGLNCIPADQLKNLSADLNELLGNNGTFTAVLMGRKCLWEKHYFRRKNNEEQAGRRQSQEPVITLIGEEEVKTWYYSPEEFASCFSHF